MASQISWFLLCRHTHTPGVQKALSIHVTLASSLRAAETSLGLLGGDPTLRLHFSLDLPRALFFWLSLETVFHYGTVLFGAACIFPLVLPHSKTHLCGERLTSPPARLVEEPLML